MNYDNFTKEQIVSILKDTLEYSSKLREEIERLESDIIKLFAKEREETKRLNNIINQLEKDMKDTIELLKNSELQKVDKDYFIETFDIFCNRLKGSDKE